MWNSKLYDYNKSNTDYKYLHLFFSEVIYDEIDVFDYKNNMMYVKKQKILKTIKKSDVKEVCDFDSLSKLIDKEYSYFKLMYSFKFSKL